MKLHTIHVLCVDMIYKHAFAQIVSLIDQIQHPSCSEQFPRGISGCLHSLSSVSV